VEDLTAMVALYRPGPMDSIPKFIDSKQGKIPITYLHPRLEEFLKESYGVIVYQDQVLLIAVHLAGFSWLKVDDFRKAMGKKLIEKMAKYKVDFIEGCVTNGIDRETAVKLYDLIEPFSGYGFNKAHACAYAWVAYQTAYLKANFTPEFMAATLTTYSAHLSPDWAGQAVTLGGQIVEVREEEICLIAEKAERLDPTLEVVMKPQHHLVIQLRREGNPHIDLTAAEDVMQIIRRHPGSDTFALAVPLAADPTALAMLTPREATVEFCLELQTELEQVVGSGAVTVRVESEHDAPLAGMAMSAEE
jgi:Bacterial DNA polymerase III alpha subunit finger domain